MSRTSSRRSRGRGSSFSLGPILVWLLALIIAIGGIASYVLLKQEPLDKQTMCPRSGPDGVTVVLLDVSDPLSNAQEAKLDRLLKSKKQPIVPKGHRLDVYLLPESKQKAERIISICSPGSFESASNVEKLNKNQKRFKVEWNKFLTQVNTVILRANTQQENQTSPISETIDFVTSSSFPNHNITTSSEDKYRLIIVSDMLQNSSSLSVFNGEIGPESDIKHGLFFGGTTYVYQLLSERYKERQTGKLILFWEQSINKAGSKLMLWEKW